MYIHEQKDWPQLHWDSKALSSVLADVRHRQGRLLGQMEALGFKLKEEAVLQTLTADVVKSSEIEGEKLDPEAVRSSIARRLGMNIGGLIPSDRNTDGMVEMMLDATRHYAKPLTDERMFGWHACLFPSGRSGMTRINTGKWRDDKSGAMQVVSGPIGRETVHYEAPVAARIEKEMPGDLLAEHGAEREFVWVRVSRNSQSATSLHERGEKGVRAKHMVDGVGIRIEVE